MHFGDVFEANASEKPRQKQNAHACVAFFKMSLEPYFANSRKYGFITLVDICKIVDRLLPTLESHQNVIYHPAAVKIFISALKVYRRFFTLWVVNLECKSCL